MFEGWEWEPATKQGTQLQDGDKGFFCRFLLCSSFPIPVINIKCAIQNTWTLVLRISSTSLFNSRASNTWKQHIPEQKKGADVYVLKGTATRDIIFKKPEEAYNTTDAPQNGVSYFLV